MDINTYEEEGDTKPTTPNDDDFDDALGIPHTLTVISVEGTPVVVDNPDDNDLCKNSK